MRQPSQVFQPGEGHSYWQPVPANGFVEVKISAGGSRQFDCGLQSVATDSRVREHAHSDHEELIMIYQGEGTAVVDGREHAMRPGTLLYLAPQSRHQFINTGSEDLRFYWLLMPGGLSDFFAAIGRPRQPGEAAPELFPRPDDVAEIEANTVFVRPEDS